ncbi:MAG: hypothetical protein ABW208_25655 [Pyrinomonadaceae bacterium]
MLPGFRITGRCEWIDGGLQDFTLLYNELHGTSYRLEKCLDVEKSSGPEPDRPQPEVLLVGSNDEPPMVIERKTVAWPRQYIRRAQHEDEFTDTLLERLNPLFHDYAYALDVWAPDVFARKTNKHEIQATAHGIAEAVIGGTRSSVLHGFSVGRKQVRWAFRRVNESDLDEDFPRRGVVVTLHGAVSDSLAGEPDALVSKHLDVVTRTRQELTKQLSAAARKFYGYDDYIKVVVLECYGEYLTDEDVSRLLVEAELPIMIDQVWLAREKWVSNYEWQLTYELARSKEKA